MRLESCLHQPPWPLPAGVLAVVTTRLGGVSAAPWDSFNLGEHVGDDPQHVAGNRHRLLNALQAFTGCTTLRVQWLKQVHGNSVFVIGDDAPTGVPEADALYTRRVGVACAVLTADCLPVVFCSSDGKEIAIAHAGWRGLANGVLEATIAHFKEPETVSAWLGAAIGPCHFEVGAEVREQFIAAAHSLDRAGTAAAFARNESGRWMADLYTLARLRLERAGLSSVYGTADCTVCHPKRWYSFRRQAQTGRFATLIMLTEQPRVNRYE